MAKSTGIVLTATAISFTNDWITTNTPNFRIAGAGLATALIFDGIEKLNEKAAVGLSVMMFIAVLFTPMHGKSPAQQLANLSKGGTK